MIKFVFSKPKASLFKNAQIVGPFIDDVKYVFIHPMMVLIGHEVQHLRTLILQATRESRDNVRFGLVDNENAWHRAMITKGTLVYR